MTKPEPELEVTTPGDREIVVTRIVNAPAKKVFQAFTTPELLKRWFVPDGWSMPVCEVDLRVGGTFYYSWNNDSDGMKHGLHGTYREIVPGERIVYAEDRDDNGNPGDAVVTTTFTETNGATTIAIAALFHTAEQRDAAVKSGQIEGWGMMVGHLVTLLG